VCTKQQTQQRKRQDLEHGHLRIEQIALALATSHQAWLLLAARIDPTHQLGAHRIVVTGIELLEQRAGLERTAAEVVDKVDQCRELVVVQRNRHVLVDAVLGKLDVLQQQLLALLLADAGAGIVRLATLDQMAVADRWVAGNIDVVARHPTLRHLDQVQAGLVDSVVAGAGRIARHLGQVRISNVARGFLEFKMQQVV
jgi:hypothetical protein